eukprot:4362627-Prymnesium_polylepis.1
MEVLHPDVERLVAMDLCLLRASARLVERLVPLRGIRWLSLPESVDHFAAFMASQLDLTIEASNLDRFRRNFATDAGGGPTAAAEGSIVFPRPLDGLASRRVLVESYVDG